ncbi:MAG: biotin--[acetyl-CoA-carboxylase] ligase [Candidatus Abyssobacteria bacterium SURF_5]|uniref:Bifunctional ligase/repressor BirA n=1 Tax=Abyssobacteria bacterium (strain SURF_5) TaxID=2093360 RepID=A0A3A4P4E3_ABYX5|nr:MAG: biotin--[acetyl-CoA-carboxylase] ligase [Candidatus Abyssubacteria bacterium SURF_5]
MEKQILQMLRQHGDAYVSGQMMSRELGVSRTMVWKTIEALRKQGFVIDSSANRGYKLVRGPNKLLGFALEVGLNTKAIGKSIVSFDSIPSTIDAAGSLAAGGAEEGTVVVAESQTGGRGRLGRAWSSPRGAGIWTSIILRPPIPPRDAPKLTLLAAVAVAAVLQETYHIDARIKWPNDVIVNNRKICGALTELVAEQDQVKYAIVSFGLNVNQIPSTFPPDVADLATSMRMETGKRLERAEVFTHVMSELDRLYLTFRQDNGIDIMNRWRARSCTLGKQVTVRLRDELVEGIARDLAEDGSLVVEVAGGRLRHISYGDVTILRDMKNGESREKER